MLIFLVKPYVYSLKVRLQLPRKLYVVDNGLRNANSFLFSEDYGRLAENVVFLQLFRRTLREPKTEIYYWTGKKQEEIDFVVVQNDQVSELYQVCWDISNEKTAYLFYKGSRVFDEVAEVQHQLDYDIVQKNQRNHSG